MTTVMTNRMPSSGRNRHFLQVTSSIPFPTTAAMPDRRTKLKATELNLVPRDSIRSESRLNTQRSPRAHSDEGEIREFQRSKMTVTSKSDNSAFNGIRDSNNKARRSHRNIVTPRRRPEDPCSTSLASPSTLTLNSDNYDSGVLENEKSKLFLPTISNRRTTDSLAFTQGVFLTDLVFEDTPLNDEPSAKSIPPPEETSIPTNQNMSLTSCNYSQDQRPILQTSVDTCPSSRTVSTRNTFVLQRVYLEGLDYMRSHVLNVEKEVDTINRQFHKVTTIGINEDWLHYIRGCNQHLLQANANLLKSDITLEVIDNEAKLVKLLNNLRADTQPDMSLVESLTELWDNLKTATQDLQVLLDKFSFTVVHRFSNNYMSNHISELQVPICQKYTFDIQNLLKDLDLQLNIVRLLLKNYSNASSDEFADESAFAKRLMVSCDVQAFPILGFVGDICGKIMVMCQTTKHWLERDEEFMHEVHEFIRETRTAARHRQRVLNSEKMKQKRVEKNFEVANNMLRSNQEKLRLIEVDLQDLEKKLNESKEEQKVRLLEINQKENMVDFLKVTLKQTRKNCRLQAKRSKLLKQVKELENYLKSMETDLETTQDQILVKSHEKILLKEKINTSKKSYIVLKSDLDRFSENLEELEAEVSGLSGQLLQLEIVHTIRTSPEILDNLTDRPSTVKLSQSLKDRIKQRLRKAVTSRK